VAKVVFGRVVKAMSERVAVVVAVVVEVQGSTVVVRGFAILVAE
jgi:hypothetical protein